MILLGKNLKILLFIILLISTVSIGKGQPASSSDNNNNNNIQQENISKIHSPHKATIYSALVPGLGQIYNKKYWKLPVIYGATGIIIYAFNFNNDQYNKYKTAYVRMDAGEITEFEGVTDKSRLIRAKDSYERDRNLNVISLAAIYLLNVVDATVDAHLFDYEITNDLSLNIQPAIKKTLDNQNTVGINCSFSF